VADRASTRISGYHCPRIQSVRSSNSQARLQGGRHLCSFSCSIRGTSAPLHVCMCACMCPGDAVGLHIVVTGACHRQTDIPPALSNTTLHALHVAHTRPPPRVGTLVGMSFVDTPQAAGAADRFQNSGRSKDDYVSKIEQLMKGGKLPSPVPSSRCLPHQLRPCEHIPQRTLRRLYCFTLTLPDAVHL
jgi:hypothetical protein